MLLQIILTVFGLSATINVSQGLRYWEPMHWENVMATEQMIVQIHTRIMEKVSELGLVSKEECADMIREVEEGGGKNNPSLLFVKFGHWLRERIISYESQHIETAWAVEKTKLMVKILRDTLKHIEEEKKLNQSDAEREETNEYELVDDEVVRLEIEKQEWELLLKTLRGKLENLAQYRR
ncbi:MAG: hypothetical protein I3275_04030 [Candidatus Moeniiplasma glomeromycotorum]|nr:hypothetical protein [Candidatus Moeniiplasma glomeromycotorum]